ncbi:phospho-sugar mutase [Alicyclobacillus sp.]|uniref:phospho-sugar mutase n=1 Tax=Alicyclobacillus sp. TaxID=61169 RepID=UPI0025BC50D2|nr:phospho-sugar mutase [Alicyclobacillus sp.]MCL6516705.1 phospho-sugar mutase [Alicyclobacillus sp.]
MDAQKRYEAWRAHTGHAPEMARELDALADRPEEIAERFGYDLEFGTGGLRGILGAGTSRMNVYTVRRATLGLARYLLSNVPDAAQRGVVIGYDCRRMSWEFARETGRVLAAAGIRAYVFRHLCPTPQLSYAVRRLHAAGGVMITASHNPPEYNGYKVYGADGGQILPDVADAITQEIEAVVDWFSIPLADPEEAKTSGRWVWVGDEMDEAYVETVVGAIRQAGVEDADRQALSVVYSPLHGTGGKPVEAVLRRAGYTNLHLVVEQMQPDGEFPTTKSPNPEEPAALERALETARRVGADIAMATDPDADRVGVAVRLADGTYRLLTGNQTGGLLVDFVLSQRRAEGRLPADGIVFKTIVTSELGAAIARQYGVAVEDTLTGFKYIGERIGHYERTGAHTFLFGYEESYGYLAGDFVRDKDAVQICLLVAEMAAHHKRQGKTLADALEDLYRRAGYHAEKLISRTLPGLDGLERIRGLMARLREAPEGLVVEGETLVWTEDYEVLRRRHTDGREETIGLPRADVLRYGFAGGSWLAVRPSGTEPKIKFYLGARGDSEAACQKTLERMQRAVERVLAGA